MNNKDKTFLCLHTVRLKSNTVELTLLHSICRPGSSNYLTVERIYGRGPHCFAVVLFGWLLSFPSHHLFWTTVALSALQRDERLRRERYREPHCQQIINNRVRRKIYFALLIRRVHVVQARQKMVLFHIGAFSTINRQFCRFIAFTHTD